MGDQTIEIKPIVDKNDGVIIGVQIGIKECHGYMNGQLMYLQCQPIVISAEYIEQFIDGLRGVVHNDRKE